ncbi:hypothetical protein V8C42DRAFT_328285 [Trichoderma barbatum]
MTVNTERSVPRASILCTLRLSGGAQTGVGHALAGLVASAFGQWMGNRAMCYVSGCCR